MYGVEEFLKVRISKMKCSKMRKFEDSRVSRVI